MASDPMWINYDQASAGPLLDADEARRNMALAMMWDGRAVGARRGVRPGGTQLQVSLAGSTITVQPGTYLVDPGLTATQGPYWACVPAAENPTGGPLAAADATNPRRDIVTSRVYDHDMDASGLRLSRTEYRAGAASPTPGAPQVQAGEVLLAYIDVPKAGNGSPVVTNVFPYTVASGGILPVRGAADIAAAVKGRYRDRLDGNVLERDSGAAWETVADPNMFKSWTPWTPSGPGTSLSIGNGTITGRKREVGKTVDFNLSLTWGSTTTWTGSGILIVLPVQAASMDNTFPALLFDASASSATARFTGVAFMDQLSRIGIVFGQSSGYMTATSPITLAAGDKLTVSGSYERA